MKIDRLFSSLYDFVFENLKMSLFWLVVRVYLGYEWLMAGYEKVISPDWVGSGAGKAVMGFANGALAKTVGIHPDVSGWYASFLSNVVLTHPVFWSNLVAYGEVFVGIGLILGVFTYLSAFFGAFMNLNYLFAGTVSTNPQMLLLSIFIMMAKKSASHIGLGYYFRKVKNSWALFR